MFETSQFSIEYKNSKEDSSPYAFIFYSPSKTNIKEQIFYNEEAWRVLSAHDPNQANKEFSFKELSDICSKWKNLTDSLLLENPNINPNSKKNIIYVDTISSYRRCYAVKAVILGCSIEKNKRNYLFILERFTPENINLLKIARQYDLSRREQEILDLVIKGYSNKEIAYELNLSLNTIKTYMRNLMGKFKVSNRSSIIAVLIKKGV